MKKILALIMALVLVLPLVSCKKKKKKDEDKPSPEVALTPIYKLDLSEYVGIDAKYYKNYNVEIKVNKVTEDDVNRVISELLKTKDVLLEVEDLTIEEGHTVYIFYKGYYLDEEENKVYFDGGSNVGGRSYALKIGSGAFIDGFESGMIGKKPADYDAQNPMIVEARFPDNYGEPSLAGKTAYFEVTVEVEDGKYLVYGPTPELTDAFVYNTLRFTDEDLAGYAGDTVVEKYRAYVFEQLKWQGISKEDHIWRAFWDSVLEGAVIKKYPEEQLKAAHDAILADVDRVYKAEAHLSTYDEVGCRYFGIPKGSDWRAEVDKYAKDILKEELIFYYIMAVEGLYPSAQMYTLLLDEYLTDALAKENITPDRFNTKEEFDSHKEQYRAKMISQHGEYYFEEKIYFALGYEAVVNYANVIEINE